MFTYSSRITDICNERVLQFGNWLLVESADLPPWVGVIDLPRKWGAREVQVYAYGPERVFGWRRGPLEELITGSAGVLVTKILQYVNAPESTIIREGNIWRGRSREQTLNPKPLNEYLADVADRSGEEYNWRPSADANGKLIVFLDWFERLGITTSALLHEGKGGGNVEAVGNIMMEDGEIYNDVLAVGEGLAWASRPTATSVDHVSIGKYGRRQTTEEYGGVSQTSTLVEHGREVLKQNAEPPRTFHLNALNVGDTWKYIALGNVLSLQFQNVGFLGGGLGFQTQVRITGMRYDPADKKNALELTTEEIRP